MKFGLFYEISVPRPWTRESERTVYQNALEQVRLADELGFDQVWAVEHHFLEEYFFKPSAIMCYSAGSFGGVRAAMTLRAMLAEMGMPSIPSLLPVPRVQTAFADDGTPSDEAWYRRAERFLVEFEWYANAMKAARERSCERSACDGRDLAAASTSG